MFNESQVIADRKYRKDLRNYLISEHWDFFITLTFNKDISLPQARALLKEWDARLNRKIFGGNWSKKKPHERSLYFAFIEHINSNTHFHLVMRPVDKEKIKYFGPPLWEKLVPSGDVLIQEITPTEWNNVTTVSYLLKEAWKSENLENYIISSVFCN